MDLARFGGALTLGAVIGIISGLVGIGGGALLIPGLLFLFGMSQIDAQGTSLAALLLPIGLLAFWEYYKQGHADVKLAAFIAVGFTLGGWVGGAWAQHLPVLLLRRGFAALLIVIAVRMLFFTS